MKRTEECVPVSNQTSFITIYLIFHITIANANCSFGWTQGFCESASGRFLDDEKVAYIVMLEILNSNLTSLRANDFNRLTNVNYLEIVACSFLDPPQIELFAGLKNLENLNISSSTIAGDASAIIGTNTSLEELSMSGNAFTSVKSHLSQKLPHVQSIDLSSNSISDIDLDPTYDFIRGGVFSYIPTVTEINLQNNKISHIENGTFMYLDAIKKVDLSFNLIHAIEPAGFNFISANSNVADIVLNISYNALWTVNKNTFHLGSRVKELDLMGNNISSLHAGAFHGLCNMKTLNLRGNTIDKVLSGVFPKNNSLERLDMGNNSIQYIGNSAFEELKSLKELCLEMNKLTSLDKTFVPLSNLIHLNLRGNQISRIPKAFYGCPELETLDLSENTVSQVQAGALAANVRLQLLLLQGNALQSNNIDCVFLFNDSSAILHNIHKYIPEKNSSGAFNNIEVRMESHKNGKCVCVFFTGQHRDKHGPPQRYLSADGCSVENMDNQDVGGFGSEESQIAFHGEQETTANIEATTNGMELHYQEITPGSTIVFTNQRATERLVDHAVTSSSQITYHPEQKTTANVEATTNGVELIFEEITSTAIIVFPTQRTTERLLDQAGTSRSLKQNPSLFSGLTASHIVYSLLSGAAIVIAIASVMCLVIKLKRACCKKKNDEHVYEEIDEMTWVRGESSNARWEEPCASTELELLPPELPPRPALSQGEMTKV